MVQQKLYELTRIEVYNIISTSKQRRGDICCEYEPISSNCSSISGLQGAKHSNRIINR